MTDKVSGVSPVGAADRRAAARRQRDRRLSARAIAPLAPAAEAATPPAPSEADASAAAFAAQLMGQSGQRKGLRGGPPVLDTARSAYLGAEYSGPAERRPKPGGRTDTDV